MQDITIEVLARTITQSLSNNAACMHGDFIYYRLGADVYYADDTNYKYSKKLTFYGATKILFTLCKKKKVPFPVKHILFDAHLSNEGYTAW